MCDVARKDLWSTHDSRVESKGRQQIDRLTWQAQRYQINAPRCGSSAHVVGFEVCIFLYRNTLQSPHKRWSMAAHKYCLPTSSCAAALQLLLLLLLLRRSGVAAAAATCLLLACCALLCDIVRHKCCFQVGGRLDSKSAHVKHQSYQGSMSTST